MKNGKYIKCTKCKRFSYELSSEEFIKQFNTTDFGTYDCPQCGNNSFSDVSEEEVKNLPMGVTISILTKGKAT